MGRRKMEESGDRREELLYFSEEKADGLMLTLLGPLS